MGFSGGGSNVLKPHKHSSAVQDGSPLNMVNVTEGSLNSGDTIYSDGNALQRLAVGAVGTTMTVSGANIPSWAAAASGSPYVLVDSQTLGSDNNTLESTFSTISQSDISRLVVVLNCQTTGAENVTIRVNGITTNTYQYDAWVVYGGATLTSNYGGQNAFNHMIRNDVLGVNLQVVGSLTCNPVSENIQIGTQTSAEDGLSTASGLNTTASQTSFDAVRFYIPAPSIFKAGSTLQVYRVNNT